MTTFSFVRTRTPSTLLLRSSSLLLASFASLVACTSESGSDADTAVESGGGTAAGGQSSGAGGGASGGESATGGNNVGGTAPGSGGGGAGGGTASGGQPSTGGMGAGGEAPGGGGETGAGGQTGTGGNSAVSVCPTDLSGAVPTLPASMGEPIARANSASLPNGSNSQLEGPVWAAGSLYVSHMRDHADPVSGTPGEVLRLSGTTLEVAVPGLGTNGLAVGPDGLILAASQQEQAVISLDPANLSAEPVVVVGEYEGLPFNSPNDLTVRSDGTIYFSDPDWNCGTCPQTENRVYRLDPTGAISTIENAHQKPNGIRLSPDEATLYLGGDAQLQSFSVMPDGSVGAPSNFGNLTGTDGVTVDCAGNLYVAQPGQSRVVVLNPAGDEVGILSGSSVTNLAFGGANGTTLYLTSSFTSNPGLYVVELDIPGLPY